MPFEKVDNRLSFTIDEKDREELDRRLGQLSIEKQASALIKGMEAIAIETEGIMRERVNNKDLQKRSGYLQKTISSVTVNHKDNIEDVIGSGVRSGERAPYADILEDGGDIRPVKSAWLTIPLAAALTRAGVMKYPTARMYPNTWMSRDGMGRPIIMQKVGKTKAQALFILRKKVTIKPHHYLTRTLEQMEPRVMSILGQVVEDVLEGRK
jgi:hypothetical protein